MTPGSTASLPALASLLAGDAASVARALTLAAAGGPESRDLLAALETSPRRSHRIAVTGPGGAGKSTLIGALAALLRSRGETVGVVACDPASPATGGAFLGDRMRMASASRVDPGLFIRSIASREAAGATPEGALRALRVLEAAGFDRVVLETVGAGQGDPGLTGRVDTLVAVLPPEAGDEYQVLKAGLLEVADVLVVNGADRPGTQTFLGHLEEEVRERRTGRRPRVVATVATRGEGVESLLAAIDEHRAARVEKEAP